MHTKIDKTACELFETQDTSAYAWAVAFCKLNPQMDVNSIASWFSNAMMVMHDKHADKNTALINKMKSLLYLTDDSVSSIIMNDTTIKQIGELARWEEEQKFK